MKHVTLCYYAKLVADRRRVWAKEQGHRSPAAALGSMDMKLWMATERLYIA